ncbi:MAG TPA: hypothetical protein VM243_18690 [Phycisphaerae bacterium]|nr:hypothetical protein [Phycisphaerae bacterium]
MKAVLVLIVLIGGVCLAVYYFGGAASFDPSQQGRDARAAVKPGMTLKKVIAAAGEPREYRVINRQVKNFAGQEQEVFKPGAKNPFDFDRVTERIANNELPHGFTLDYFFSNKVAFAVTFDATGTAMSVDDLTTMADLLQIDKD